MEQSIAQDGKSLSHSELSSKKGGGTALVPDGRSDLTS